jgi:hypothetical protein
MFTDSQGNEALLFKSCERNKFNSEGRYVVNLTFKFAFQVFGFTFRSLTFPEVSVKVARSRPEHACTK